MRIAREASVYNAYSRRALTDIQLNLSQAQAQLSSGKRINRASDDPTGFARAQEFGSAQSRFEQYDRSLESARGWINTSQEKLGNLSELLTQAYEKGIQGANAAMSQADRAVIATELQSIIGEMAEQLNSRHGDDYVFSGTATDTQAFTVVGTTVTYTAGTTNDPIRRIGNNLGVQVSFSGDEVHDPGNGFTITEAVDELANALNSGDQALITTWLDRVDQSRDHVVDKTTEIARSANRMESTWDQLRLSELEVTARKSQIEDADYAETVERLLRLQTNYEAALRANSVMLSSFQQVLNILR